MLGTNYSLQIVLQYKLAVFSPASGGVSCSGGVNRFKQCATLTVARGYEIMARATQKVASVARRAM